jgi:hypothetical protein
MKDEKWNSITWREGEKRMRSRLNGRNDGTIEEFSLRCLLINRFFIRIFQLERRNIDAVDVILMETCVGGLELGRINASNMTIFVRNIVKLVEFELNCIKIGYT